MKREILGTVVIAAAASFASAQDAQVRVVHASPDAPNVDVAVDDVKTVFDLGFTGATGYLALPAATYNFKVTPAGAAAPVVIDADLGLMSGVSYTVAAVNTLSDIEPLVLVDDNTIFSGQSRVRFIHASPDAPAVDIAVAGGPVIIPNTSFKGFSDYLTLDPGSYDLEVRLAGTSDIVLEVPALSLSGDTVYSVWAMGFATPGAGAELQAVVTVDAIPAPGALAAIAGIGGLLGVRRRRA